MADSRGQLHTLAHNFSLLSLDGNTLDKQKLNSILDDLNAINYNLYSSTESNVVSSLVKTISWTVPPFEPFLVSKTCKFLYRLVKKQQIQAKESRDICSWVMKALTQCNHSIIEDILEALYIVLKNSVHHTPQLCEDLIGKDGVLLRFVKEEDATCDAVPPAENRYVELSTLKCIQALTRCQDGLTQSNEKRLPLPVELLQKAYFIAIRYLYKKRSKGQDEINYCEMLICANNILLQIYSVNCDIETNLGEVVGACRCWMLYALEGCESIKPRKVLPSQQAIAEAPLGPSNKGGKRLKLRKHRNSKPISSWKENSNTEDATNNTPHSANFSYTAANSAVSNYDIAAFLPWTVTSESDMSDSESSRLAKIKSLQAKTRLAALNLLTVVIRSSEKHVIFGYWWALLPGEMSGTSLGQSHGGGGLALCLQKESTASGRAAALTSLLSLLTVSRTYLAQAETSKRATTAFTPFSVTLGHTLENLHMILCYSLANERSVPVLVVTLKCVVACIQATPYKKLDGTLLIDIVKNVKKLLTHKDWTIQVAALIVMGCVVSVDPFVPEIIDMLLTSYTSKIIAKDVAINISSNERHVSNAPGHSKKHQGTVHSDSDLSDNESEDEIIPENQTVASLLKIDSGKESDLVVLPEIIDKISWLVEICLLNLGWTFKNGKMENSQIALIPIRVESLQVLSAIALQHFERLLSPLVTIMTTVLCSGLRDPVTDVCFHAAKCVSSMGFAMQKTDASHGVFSLPDGLFFWTSLLKGSLTEILQSEHNAPARAIACDCISSMGEDTFIHLPDNLKLLSGTLLLGSSGDEDPAIRAAAVRALAVCIMYQHWREDTGFLSDCGESVLRVLKEPIPAVKIKATWALANITDALLLNLEDPEIESIDDNLLTRLLYESVVASKENDKIKMNGVRAIGNIMLLLNEDHLKCNSKLESTALTAIERLIFCASNGNNMKVRWNACHALGKTMKNETLFVHFKKWQDNLFTGLCDLIEKCRNLKVRSHAVTALRSPRTRQLYGVAFAQVWTSMLSAMDSVRHTDDFTEYLHKDHLVEQLCVTLCHLACVLVSEDLSDILEITSFHWECAEHLMKQVVQRIEPQSETCSKLLDAAKFVTTGLTADTEKQKDCLNILQNMFIWET